MVDVYFYASEEVEDVGHFVLECEDFMERRGEERRSGRLGGWKELRDWLRSMKEGTRTVAGKYLCTVSSICVCAPRAHKELRPEELERVTAI